MDLLDIIDESPEGRDKWRSLRDAVRQTYDDHPSEDEQDALYERLRAALLKAGPDGVLADFLKYVNALEIEGMIAAEAAFALGQAVSRGKPDGVR